MTGISAVGSACVAGLAFAFSGSAAQAISIAYVKNGGNDALTCADVANACQTLGGALTKVDEGGEIYIVDTSNYEFVAINKSISIIALQPQGHIHVFGGAIAVTINADTNDVIHLAGLDIDGGTGTNGIGIRILQAGRVDVRDCVIRNFKGDPGTGLSVETATNVQVFVSNCAFSGNDNGIIVDPTAGAAAVMLDNVQVEKNSAIGIGSDGATSFVFLNDSIVTLNGTGLSATNSGKIVSYRNNAISGNTASDAPTLSIPLR